MIFHVGSHLKIAQRMDLTRWGRDNHDEEGCHKKEALKMLQYPMMTKLVPRYEKKFNINPYMNF